MVVSFPRWEPASRTDSSSRVPSLVSLAESAFDRAIALQGETLLPDVRHRTLTWFPTPNEQIRSVLLEDAEADADAYGPRDSRGKCDFEDADGANTQEEVHEQQRKRCKVDSVE